jgi:hypothetical protein
MRHDQQAPALADPFADLPKSEFAWERAMKDMMQDEHGTAYQGVAALGQDHGERMFVIFVNLGQLISVEWGSRALSQAWQGCCSLWSMTRGDWNCLWPHWTLPRVCRCALVSQLTTLR